MIFQMMVVSLICLVESPEHTTLGVCVTMGSRHQDSGSNLPMTLEKVISNNHCCFGIDLDPEVLGVKDTGESLASHCTQRA